MEVGRICFGSPEAGVEEIGDKNSPLDLQPSPRIFLCLIHFLKDFGEGDTRGNVFSAL